MDWSETDQNRRVPPPPLQKEPEADAPLVDLPAGPWDSFAATSLVDAIENRRSRRSYNAAELSLEELAFLLWATQGVQRVLGPGAALRTVPSAGARHAFETYLCVFRVDGLEPGLYRYLALSHQLLSLGPIEDLSARLSRAALRQKFCGNAAVTFVWSAIPYRMEWRYGLAAHRVLLIDAGHVAQNLYLACEAIGAGTCAVAAYDQHQMDALLGLDGDEEYTIYLASVGRPKSQP
jgi:SagB-type dehydrogenase family enzyme